MMVGHTYRIKDCPVSSCIFRAPLQLGETPKVAYSYFDETVNYIYGHWFLWELPEGVTGAYTISQILSL
jgi:hypothetical protein